MGGATTTTTKFSSSSFSSSMREKKETRVFVVHQTRRRLPFFFFLLRINKQRGGEGGKKNEEDEEQRKKEQKQKKQRFFRFFLLFCFLPCLCLLILRFKNISVSKEGKKVPLTEKVTFLLFYIAPHKTRAQNAKHSPLSRSKIHIFDSYILQVKRSTRAAINGSFAHHPQTNKRIVIWKGKKIPSSIFFYKKRP